MTVFGLDDALVDVRVESWPEHSDDLGVLTVFFAHFVLRDDQGDERSLGRVTGWFAFNALGADIADAADAVHADASHIGYVASLALKEAQETEPFLEDVVLVDRIWIEETLRGRGYLTEMIKLLVRTFRLHINGCVMVADPEPRRPEGGPYADGPERDGAMAGLVRTLSRAGFSPWKDGKAMWMLITDTAEISA